ncbi:hypothetical protein BJ878DRAFT_486564 [Calycina marina]|uniref:Uncharacterized protein n=1 Tax=Calycina marina TaxID=1763456 RepID=A0A9P7ZC39_9HELO|nr:hypothetical protein BJ878DRAFT_486564 [Calycina marina]
MPRRWSSVEIATHRAIAPFIYLPTQSPQTSSTRFKICRDRARTMLPVATVGDELAHIIRSRLMTRRITGSTPQVPSSIVVEHASTESKTNTDDENALKDGCEYVVTGAQIDEITNMIKSTLRRESQKNSSTSETDYTSPPRMKKLKSRVTSFTSRGVIPRIGSAVKTSVTAAEAYRFSGRLMEVASEFNFPPKPAESLGAERKFQRSKHEVVWTPGSSDIRREPGFLEIRLTSEDLSTHLDERSHESSTVSCQKSQAFDPKNAIASIHQWSWDLPSKQSVAFQNLNIGTSTDTSPQVATRLAAKRVGSMSRADELRLQASDSGANLKPHGSESNISRGSVIEEVVSFPPLPRKSTFDWICPLPDLDSVIAKRQSSASTTKKQSTSSGSYTRCLYDQGVDATIWVNSRSASPSPGASPRSEDAGTKPLSPVTLSSSKGMNSLYEEEIDARIIGSSGHPRDAQPVFQEPSYSLKTCPSSPKIKFREPKEVSRIKSGILSPPRTQTRQGSQSTMGSWIGASGHHKRKSLHVAIRENSMRPSTKATSWDKARADSIYPEHHTSELSAESTQFTGNSSETVSKDHSWHKPRADSSYPQQVSFSSTETADADNIDAEGSEGSGIIAPSPNREALVRNRYHVMPVKDHIGIYDSMTGVRRARRQSQICTTLGCDLERGHRVKISRDPSVDWIG